jgi:hypothetical protein
MCYLAGRYPILSIPQERKMRQNKTKYTLRGRGFDLTIKCQQFSAAATILLPLSRITLHSGFSQIQTL